MGDDPSRWLTAPEKLRELAFFNRLRDDADHYRTAHPKAHGGEGWIDPEVLPLVDALNEIEGVCTTQSCCGHRYPVSGEPDAEMVHRGQLWLRLIEPVSRYVDHHIAGLLCHDVICRVTRQYAYDGGSEPEEFLDILFEPGAVDEATAVLVPFFELAAMRSGAPPWTDDDLTNEEDAERSTHSEAKGAELRARARVERVSSEIQKRCNYIDLHSGHDDEQDDWRWLAGLAIEAVEAEQVGAPPQETATDDERNPVRPVGEFCKAFREWHRVLVEARDRGDFREDDRNQWDKVIDALDTLQLPISKSNFLWRLIYRGEQVREEKCPEHNGHWSGYGVGGAECECNSGMDVTGWLPGEPLASQSNPYDEKALLAMTEPEAGQEQVGAPRLDLTREEAEALVYGPLVAVHGQMKVDPAKQRARLEAYESAVAKLRAFLAGAPPEDDDG